MLTTLCVDYGEKTKNASIFSNSTAKSIFTYILRGGEVIKTSTDQLWFWSNEWQEGERRVDKYIHEGNVQEFDTMEEFLRTLRE
jgi:hypothetical protein